MIVPILMSSITLGISLITSCYRTNYPKISSLKTTTILLSLMDLLVDWDQLGDSSAGFIWGLSCDYKWYLRQSYLEAESSISWNIQNGFFSYVSGISGFLLMAFISIGQHIV